MRALRTNHSITPIPAGALCQEEMHAIAKTIERASRASISGHVTVFLRFNIRGIRTRFSIRVAMVGLSPQLPIPNYKKAVSMRRNLFESSADPASQSTSRVHAAYFASFVCGPVACFFCWHLQRFTHADSLAAPESKRTRAIVKTI